MRRISEGTIQGVQKGDQWLIPHEEMKKLADESLEKPNGEPLSEWEVNGLTALTVLSSESGGEKEDSRSNRARELFSEWLKGLKHAKWNDKWDVKVKEWVGWFFQIVERLRKREVEEEGVRQKVSLKLGSKIGRAAWREREASAETEGNTTEQKGRTIA